jgi:hypothetical protein
MQIFEGMRANMLIMLGFRASGKRNCSAKCDNIRYFAVGNGVVTTFVAIGCWRDRALA